MCVQIILIIMGDNNYTCCMGLYYLEINGANENISFWVFGMYSIFEIMSFKVLVMTIP